VQAMSPVIQLMEGAVVNYLPLIEATRVGTSTALLPEDPEEQAEVLQAQAEQLQILQDAETVIHVWQHLGEAYRAEYEDVYNGKLVPLTPPPELQKAEQDYLFALGCAVATLELLDLLNNDGEPLFEEEELEAFREELERKGLDVDAIWPEEVA
jgi:hypothetical protein